MTIRNAPTWLGCLCVLLSLAGCGEQRQSVRPAKVIEVPMPAWQPLDKRLTDPLAEPAPPPATCRIAGMAVPCVLPGLAQIEAWRGVLQRCNADRATTRQITGIKDQGD